MAKIVPNKVPYIIPQPNNMGMVRYLLAITVVISHFTELCGYRNFWPISSYDAVGGFFALSGFLIFGSYIRNPKPLRFIRSRCRRILPAYWTTVIFFAVVLVFLSTADHYFGSAGFWKYFVSNMLFMNFLEPSLPGVFMDNLHTAVNGSLWTMKVEWMLYLSVLPVAWLMRVLRRRSPAAIIAAIYVVSVLYRLLFITLYEHTGSEIYNILSRQFLGQLMYFYTGVLIYFYFNYFMKYRYHVLAVAIILFLFNYFIPFASLIVRPLYTSVIVLWISMVGKWGTWEGKRDNISYNIYLVHFPIIQICIYLHICDAAGPYVSFMAVLAATVLLAWLINLCVEKPLKKLFLRHPLK